MARSVILLILFVCIVCCCALYLHEHDRISAGTRITSSQYNTHFDQGVQMALSPQIGRLKKNYKSLQRHDVADSHLKMDANSLQLHDVADRDLNMDFNSMQRHEIIAESHLKTDFNSPQRNAAANGNRNDVVRSHLITDYIKKSVQRRSLGSTENRPVTNLSTSLPQLILQDLLLRCADVQVCNSDVLENYNISSNPNRTCCIRCDCNPTCIRTKSCCPDEQLRTDISFQYIRKNNNTRCIHPTDNAQTYEFVSVCPESSSFEEHLKCKQLSETDDLSQGETMPVFDKKILINYRNIHCAECNGASRRNLVMWWSAISCGTNKDGVEMCSTQSSAPNEPGINVTKCSPHALIEECNITGKWEEYNQFVEEACFYLHLQYVTPKYRYKNVFCALCNGFRIEFGCLQSHDNARQSLTGLIQFDLPVTKTGHYQSNCIPGYKMDPISRTCREIVCSWPRRWDTNKQLCVETAFFKEAQYDIPLEVEYNGTLSIQYITRLKTQLLVDLFYLAPPPLQVCSLKIVAKIDDYFDEIYVQWESREFWLQLSIRKLFILVGVTAVIRDLLTVKEAYLIYDAFRKRIKQLADDRNVAKREDKCKLGETTSDNLDFSKIWYVFDTFDSYIFHPRTDMGIVVEFKEDVEQEHMSVFKGHIYMFKNVYDGTTMLDINIREDPFKTCIQNFKQSYDWSFLYCPTFEYGLTEHNISRCPDGIELRGRDVKFGFEEFRSVNETYVRICVASVLKKVVFFVSSGMVMRYSIPYIVMAAVGATVGIY